jgi:predicted transposase/invertase (TIGR01784 family)
VEKTMTTTKTPGRYARILLDYWFKRAFGTESRKRLLMLFLQEVIPEHRIASLTYAPQEHENPNPDMKGIRVDVECTDEDGTRFVVEMQLAYQKHFYERALFNSTFAIQEQMIAGQESYDFPAVYFIGLMDFTIHEGSDRVMFRYDLRDQSTNELMTDRIQFIFLELPNCRIITPDSTVLEKFCYALHNMENLPDRPEGFEGELFRLLFETAEIAKFTPQEKTKFEYDMRTERDLRNQIAYAEEKGREEGREEERIRQEARLRTIEENLRKRGLSEEDIAELMKES